MLGEWELITFHKLDLLSKQELENSLDFELGAKSILVTFHPVTLESNTSGDQMRELLASLSEFTGS